MRLDLMRGSGFSPLNAVRSLTVPVFSFEAPGPIVTRRRNDAQA